MLQWQQVKSTLATCLTKLGHNWISTRPVWRDQSFDVNLLASRIMCNPLTNKQHCFIEVTNFAHDFMGHWICLDDISYMTGRPTSITSRPVEAWYQRCSIWESYLVLLGWVSFKVWTRFFEINSSTRPTSVSFNRALFAVLYQLYKEQNCLAGLI